MIKLVALLITCLSILISSNCLAEDEFVVTTASSAEVNVERFAASGKYLILWVAPEYGFRAAHRDMALLLTKQSIEVWQSDILLSLFLPQSSSALKKLDGSNTADLIEYAHKTTGKKIVVAGDSYASVSALAGAHQWQQRQQSSPYLVGAILFSPRAYAYIPSLGLEPEFMPIISATNIPVMIYQAKNGGTVGQFQPFLAKLRENSNAVYFKYISTVMSLFYKKIPKIEMIKVSKTLPFNIRKMITLLEKHDVPAKPVPLQKTNNKMNGVDSRLKIYQANSNPVEINLQDVKGNTYAKKDFSGQVTLVNFWATWCPPCVKEIPMLNRLKRKMADSAFELISINFAEDKQIVTKFMRKVNVEFPVLLDPTGEFSKRWNVVSFPSTFVIGPDGKIKFGVNAAIEWDKPEYVQKLKSMLSKKPK